MMSFICKILVAEIVFNTVVVLSQTVPHLPQPADCLWTLVRGRQPATLQKKRKEQDDRLRILQHCAHDEM